MSRLSVVATPYMLCVLSVSCRVYDAELIQQLATGGRANTISAGVSMLDASAADATAAGEPREVLVPACGNGRVDERERCDIAIPKGEPGACPDGCHEQDGCFAHELAGQRCGARCVPKEISESIPGDGCCPKGATAATDSDCSATCGNGVIEDSETCDPKETCPKPETCTTQVKCSAARLTGAAETCSARCQVQPISACESGDGCCPSGCNAQDDRDCLVGGAAMPGESSRTSTQAGTAPAEPTKTTCMDGKPCSDDQLAAECAMVHSGGRCHSCDCAYCATNVAQCASITKDTSSCARLTECALQNHCKGMQCLCGDSNLGCASNPQGRCMWEIRDVAGTRDYYDILWQANTPGSALAIAMELVQCRANHCAETCGL